MKKHGLIALLLLFALFLCACSGTSAPEGHSRLHLRRDLKPPEPVSPIPFSEFERVRLSALTFRKTGTAATCSAQGVRLRIDWELEKKADSDEVTAIAYFFLDYAAPFSSKEGTGAVCSINGSEKSFSLPALALTEGEASHRITGVSLPLPYFENAGSVLTAEVTVTLDEKRDLVRSDDGKHVSAAPGTLHVTARMRVPLPDETLPSSASVKNVKPVLQNPELPNGCEITSLTVLLNHRGIGIDKLTASDVYLPKNTDTYHSDFTKEYAGDPRLVRGALGCFAPVIVQCAQDILAEYDKEGSYEAQDLTGSSPEELYRQVSLGTPAAVWITEDLSVSPTVLRAWTSTEGKPMIYPYPLHCVVLTGYDTAAKTVTLADPMIGEVTRPMELFEARYLDLGCQAVIVTEKTSQ